MNQNLLARIEAVADPAAPFLETMDGRRLSYGDAFALSGQIANALAACGVRVGDRVVAQVDKTPEALALYLACLRAGAVYLPLDMAFTANELAYFVADAEPKLIVCTPAVREAATAIAAGAAVETLDRSGKGSLMEWATGAPGAFAIAERGDDDLAALLYTSGTTGRSKGAMLTHDNLASNALALVDAWRFTGDDVLIHALPLNHTHGLFVATNTVMFAGASLVFLPKFDADAILKAMARATVLMGVPTYYTRLLKHPGLTREAVAGMRLFTSGSAPLLAETHRAFAERTGQAILERYGMTETSMNTSNPYDGDRVAGTVGFPLPGVHLRITDPETGATLPDGKAGMIEVRGPNVFKGYWRMPDKTAAEFRSDGYFITGDIGMIDGRGYVSIVGRAKDLVISGGVNVYPKEVEAEIDALPGVVELAVIGTPHADLGEGVVAVVVTSAPAATSEAAILAALDGRLAGFKRPKRVVMIDELPRNAMGKVQKNVLRERYRDVLSGAT